MIFAMKQASIGNEIYRSGDFSEQCDRKRFILGGLVCFVLFLTGCDGSGDLGKSRNCTCPKPEVHLCEMAKENLTGGDLVTFSGDGDIDTVKYIIARLRDDIPLPRWHAALEAALQHGHVQIAEILMKEIAKLPKEYSTLSKRDWDDEINLLANSNHASACDAMRFVFKYAGNTIDNPLNHLWNMSDCKLQACIDFGYLNDNALQSLKEDKKGLIAAVYFGHCHHMHHRGAFEISKEKVLENQQMAAEAFAMVKRLLDNGYHPSLIDIASLKNESSSEEAEAKDAKIKILKLLENYK